MKIVACCKIVPNEEEIKVLADRKISLEATPWKISQYDLNALETGKQLIAQVGGSMTALTVGSTAALEPSKIRKDILSRGASDLTVVINDTHSFSNSLDTAKALMCALKESEAFDLVLCGTGSSDVYSQEVGVQLGALLGLPTLNNVTAVSVEGETLTVERTLEDSVEIYEVSMPAVLSVSSEINIPAVPAMRDIMGAGKKPVNALNLPFEEITSPTTTLEELAPEQQERRMEIIEGDGEEAVAALVQFLKKEVL